jgi:hypothetical protein
LPAKESDMVKRSDYAPYDTMHAFEIGVQNYRNGRWVEHHYREVEAQAYDRGFEYAMKKDEKRRRCALTPDDAKPGCCQEAALGLSFYSPCNHPAVAMVGWPNRNEGPYRMCAACTEHNVRSRGAQIVGEIK